jgi:diaminohydroxyphosphoribosylaminopyrimidine deaminase/5-amino-6-(5-phosphoribosylamino)uracil reductase
VRCIVDARLDTPAGARLFDAASQVLLYTASQDAARRRALEARGAQIVAVAAGADGRLDVAAVLEDIAGLGINELHVEAGARLNGALLRADLVDDLLVYQAPVLLGPGRSMADLPALDALADAPAFRFVSATLVGEDLRVIARRR